MNFIDFYRKKAEDETLAPEERANFVAAMWSNLRKLTTQFPIVVREEDED